MGEAAGLERAFGLNQMISRRVRAPRKFLTNDPTPLKGTPATQLFQGSAENRALGGDSARRDSTSERKNGWAKFCQDPLVVLKKADMTQ